MIIIAHIISEYTAILCCGQREFVKLRIEFVFNTLFIILILVQIYTIWRCTFIDRCIV